MHLVAYYYGSGGAASSNIPICNRQGRALAMLSISCTLMCGSSDSFLSSRPPLLGLELVVINIQSSCIDVDLVRVVIDCLVIDDAGVAFGRDSRGVFTSTVPPGGARKRGCSQPPLSHSRFCPASSCRAWSIASSSECPPGCRPCEFS